ncbi:GntR family transcriptional regulator [Ensifer sp. LCM 4579]|uniref:GntR family transcriptional regulator n=1 Tax=Ensifer sp. LCM 4579 TaxID=1848292 RepID=UPI0008D97F7E|nr:GntR family transcriptional regulator [Ensifer sp. LCM 4579]OHV79755.1 phosphonate metabolism transcriptional regulator PhnF [Ensifer sp. LCM 4579]
MLEQSNSPLAAFDGLTFAPRQDSPIWQQIYNHILGRIESGVLSPGEQLPGENHMAARLGVTRVTLRRALQQLQKEGHLTARKGVGIFVRSPPAIFSIRDGRSFRENIDTHSGSISTVTRLLACDQADQTSARILGVAVGSAIIHLRRVRLLSEQPIYVNDKYFPAHRFPDFDRVYGERQSVSDVFRAHGIDTFRRAETRISGGFASPEEAEILQLTPGTPVFRINARNTDGTNDTIEWTRGCWPLTSVEFVFGPS